MSGKAERKALFQDKIQCLRKYLRRLEKNRTRDEQWNKNAYQQARHVAAWLSLYDFGNDDARSMAESFLRNLLL